MAEVVAAEDAVIYPLPANEYSTLCVKFDDLRLIATVTALPKYVPLTEEIDEALAILVKAVLLVDTLFDAGAYPPELLPAV